MSLEYESAHGVVESMYGALDLAILLGSVGARKAKNKAELREESVNRIVEKLCAIISLKSANKDSKLCARVGEKVLKNTGNIRFMT
jgi:hypothetical protein